MIKLTKLNNSVFYLNPHVIETLEENPDTTITTTSDKKYIVLESIEDINDMLDNYYIKIFNSSFKKNKDEFENEQELEQINTNSNIDDIINQIL